MKGDEKGSNVLDIDPENCKELIGKRVKIIGEAEIQGMRFN